MSTWTWTLSNGVEYFKIFTVRDKRQMKPIPFQSSWQKFSRNKSSVTLSFSDSENSEGICWNPGKGNFIGHIILPPIKGPKNFPFGPKSSHKLSSPLWFQVNLPTTCQKSECKVDHHYWLPFIGHNILPPPTNWNITRGPLWLLDHQCLLITDLNGCCNLSKLVKLDHQCLLIPG